MRAVSNAEGQQTLTTDMLHSGGGVTRPRVSMRRRSRASITRRVWPWRMGDRPCHTMIRTMGIAVEKPSDAIVPGEQNQKQDGV